LTYASFAVSQSRVNRLFLAALALTEGLAARLQAFQLLSLHLFLKLFRGYQTCQIERRFLSLMTILPSAGGSNGY
jgi:hypothetical protein